MAGSSQMSADAAYNAAIVTRDRALAGHQEAIDLLQRLLAQMGDDPLVVKTKENLMKILENPEVITDEVFGNIMSKTAEVLDVNYDQEVQQVLGAARSKGVAGPALQITLQRAKEARATAIAGAYRDAIIERANSGLKTSMDAITSASNLLNNLFNQQRVVSEDLANVMREVVPEPARSFGVDPTIPATVPSSGGGAGGVPGVSGGVSGTMSAMPSGTFGMDAEKSYNEMVARNTTDASLDATIAKLQAEQDARNKASRWNPDGTPKTTTTPSESPTVSTPGQPGVPVPLDTADQRLSERPNTFKMNGKSYTMDSNGRITETSAASVLQSQSPTISVPSVTSPGISPSALQTQVTPMGSLASVPSSPYTSDIQAAMKSSLSPVTGLGTTVTNNFAQPTSGLSKTEYNNIYGTNYNEQVVPGSVSPSNPQGISTGGGAAEATRAGDLISQGYDVIGTTDGAGVRKDINNQPISAGDALSDKYSTAEGAVSRTSATPTAAATSAAYKAHIAAGGNDASWNELMMLREIQRNPASTNAAKEALKKKMASGYDPNMSTSGGGYRK